MLFLLLPSSTANPASDITSMAALTSGPPPYAPSPFDNTLDGNLILRSSDCIDFRVVRAILRLASPFFASMLEVGQALLPSASDGAQADGDEIRDGCRVVPVSENSATLDTLLRVIYPQEDPPLDDFTRLADVLAAALKYDMVKATTLTGTKLRGFVAQDPVRVWAVAVRNRLEVEARLAADEICRQAIVVLDVFPDEMRDINSGAYYRLLQYRRLGGAVEEDFKFCDPAIPLASNPDPDEASVASPPPPGNEPRVRLPPSLRPHFRSIADVVCRSSDGREFPAHKALLMLASPAVLGPLIAEMSTCANPASGEADGPGVLRASPILFEEDGETLQILLGLCHSNELDTDIDVQELFVVPRVRHALSKYEMSDALEVLRGQWSTLMAEDPLRAYMLASRYGDTEEARKAARLLLNKAMEDYYTPLLENTPASLYRAALLCHRACRGAASEVGTMCQSAASGYPSAPDDFNLPHASPICERRRHSCSGVRYLVQYPEITGNGCVHCTMYAKIVTRAIAMLNSQSDPLLTTLDILRGSPSQPNSSAAQWLSSPLDRITIQTLYTTLYDKVTARVNEVCRSP